MPDPEIDEDVFARNCYMVGAKRMQERVISAFASGESVTRLKRMTPEEPNIERLRMLELERLQNIAEN